MDCNCWVLSISCMCCSHAVCNVINHNRWCYLEVPLYNKVQYFHRKYDGVIQRIYSGIQCSSCGLRFAPDQVDRYREHLDWHFRQNRREKDGVKVAKYRRWYYSLGVSVWSLVASRNHTLRSWLLLVEVLTQKVDVLELLVLVCNVSYRCNETNTIFTFINALSCFSGLGSFWRVQQFGRTR